MGNKNNFTRINKCPDVVYCNKCKYYKVYDIGVTWRPFSECTAHTYYEYDYRHCWKVYDDPRDKNVNNDCPDFELKTWRKIVKYIFHTK